MGALPLWLCPHPPQNHKSVLHHHPHEYKTLSRTGPWKDPTREIPLADSLQVECNSLMIEAEHSISCLTMLSFQPDSNFLVLGHKNVVQDSVNGSAKCEVNGMCCCPLIHKSIWIRESITVPQEWHMLDKTMLTLPIHLLVPTNEFLQVSLHIFFKYQSEAGQPADL